MATVFSGAGSARGDLRAVVRAILLDPEARGDVKTDANYGRLRHPAQFIANVLRAFGARSADGAAPSDGYLNPQSVPMGMDVFRPPSVFSYFSPTTVVPWLRRRTRPGVRHLLDPTALRRINFVNTIVFANDQRQRSAGTSIDLSPLPPLASSPGGLVDALNELLLHGTMSAEMRSQIVGAVGAVASSNAIKRVRTAVYLVLTSLQYQVER